jgi:hypothetical protein
MSPPRTATVPDWICRAPAARLSSVDLPTPSGPISPAMLPAGMSKLTELSAVTGP